MKKLSLKNENNTFIDLVDAKTDKQLNEQIVENARQLVKADCGNLYLYNKERLKRSYDSNDLIKNNVILTSHEFNKFLITKEIFILTAKDFNTIHNKQLPKEIKLFVVVPLIYAQQTLGFLFLYFNNPKKSLNKYELQLLNIYKHTATLALTKSRLQIESQKAMEIRDKFISLASHELRTPLTSIHGYIQLLHSRMKTQDTIESRWMKELYIESMRMTNLVKELLDVNRIKQGQFAFVFSEVPMKEVVTKAIERYRLTNSDLPILFRADPDAKKSVVVGDFDKLVEMVSGLLGNAVKFSKPGEKITVTLNYNPKSIILEVKDTGKGISKKDLSAIFNGFYKSENSSYIEGMGVGLLVAKHIVDNHRGKLKIRSKMNIGTSVTITLPTIKE
jgi:signal transduction histidine kinase